MQPADNHRLGADAAMLAGDFTTFASPACNGGRQINLGGGFVNNRIDPAQLSPAALNMVKYLPSTTDPCGQVHYSFLDDSTEHQYLGRADFQRTSDDTIFGRYMATKFDKPIPMREGDSALSLYDAANVRNILGMDALSHSLVIGDTRVFGPDAVNSLRFSFNRSGVYRLAPDTFDPYDIGSDVYAYQPDTMVVIVTGNGFQVNNPGPSRFTTDASQVSNDLTLVRGNHQTGDRRQRRLLEVLLPVARAIGRELDVPRPADRPRAWRTSSRAASAGWSTAGRRCCRWISGTSGPTRRTPGASLRG